MNENDINDVRSNNDFKNNTFSDFKKSDVKKELIKSLYNNQIEKSCYWSIEYICAGQFIDLWEIILFYMSKYIHLGNPKLPIYIELRFNNFKEIINNGYEDNDLSLRNNNKIRKLFSEIIGILCTSKKKHSIEYVKLDKNEDFDISNIHSKLKAPNIKFIEKYFKKDDPKELFIMLNEFTFHLSKQSKNSTSACYWLEWLLEFENICKKKKEILLCERREFIPVDDKFQKEAIWIIWEIILDIVLKDKFKSKIINSLLNLYCLRYTSGTKKKRKGIIYFAISIITETVNNNEDLVYNKENIDKIVKNINLLYKEIKKNEHKPNTDYLFENLNESKSNKEKTIEKLDKINNLNTIIRN
jgi:hypothetical protein